MRMPRLRRTVALVTAAAVLASMTVATVATPASAAKPKCQGKTATIVGTRKGERIIGTARRDVIVAKGGNDRIFGRGGNDLICAGGGNDTVYGGPGADTIWGQLGNDRLFGNAGPDFLAGQVGNDPLNGGIGVDKCYQGTGGGARVACELPAPPAPPAAPAPPPPPAGPTLIPLAGILAVAYSDIDGLDGYSTGDVLIARLMDTSGDGEPGAGDIVEMGRYPVELDPSAADFADWREKSHAVASVVPVPTKTFVKVTNAAGGDHKWVIAADYEGYSEDQTDGSSTIRDGGTDDDTIFVQTGSPSRPVGNLNAIEFRIADNRFVDVEILYTAP